MEISVIVCARNEEKNLELLFESLASQKNTLNWEIIFVNDFSNDTTFQKMSAFKEVHKKVTIIDLQDVLPKERGLFPNKKIGIQLAIEKAKGEYILATDADCSFSENWIASIFNHAEHTAADLICSPVVFRQERAISRIFQQLDMLALQAATKWTINTGLPILCNGANLAYRKEVFKKLNPYSANQREHSGDDIFLLQAFMGNGKKTVYNQDVDTLVETNSADSFTEFIHQRIRWAGKSTGYKNLKISLFLVLLFSFNLGLLLLFLSSILKSSLLKIAIPLFVLKLLMDSLVIYPQAKFYKKDKLLLWMPFMECLHIFYVVFIGLLSLRKSYHWKGRDIKRNP